MRRYTMIILLAVIAGLTIVLAISLTRKPNNPPYVPDNPVPKSGSENIGESVVLSWGCSDPDGDELRYEIYIGDDPEDLKLVAKDLKTNSYRLSGLKPGRKYYWKVVAFDSKGGKSESPIWNFKTVKLNRPPVVESGFPSDGATNVSVDIVLSWKAHDPDGDPLSYDVYFGEDEPKLVVSGIKENTFSPGKLEYSKEYMWKIVARDSKGAKAESPVWKFKTMEKPLLPPSVPRAISPKDGSKDVPTRVKLVWESTDPQNLPLRYDLYFGKSPNPKLIAKDLKDNEYELKDLENGTTYYWKVIVRNSKGLENTGGIWRFKTKVLKNNPPSVPSSPKPENDALDVSTSTVLSWKCSDPDGDAVRYIVYLGKSPNDLKVIASNLEKSEYELKNLEYSTTYYWKVVAVDEKGARTQSDVWKFTTRERPNNPPVFESVSVLERSEKSVVLSWKAKDPDGDTIVFDLYFGESENPQLYRSNLEVDSIKIGNLKPGKTYHWYVVAKDPKGATAKSKLSTFKTKEVKLPKPSIDRLVVAGGPEGIFLLNVSNPRKPTILSKLSVPNVESISYTEFKFYNEDMKIALGGGKDGLTISRVKGDSLEMAAQVEDYKGDRINVKDVLGVKRFALLSLWNMGFGLLDIFTPANPNWLGVVRLPGFSQSVDLSDVNAYLSLRSEGVGIVSIERPFEPKMIGKFDVDGIVVDTVVEGNLAYVLSVTDGISIYDISSLEKPIRLSKVNLEGGYRLFFKDSKLYAVGEFGLAIIDVLDPRNPKIISKIETKGPAKGIFVSGPYAYVCADDLEIVLVENPEKPLVVGRFDFGSSAVSVKVYSNNLFVVDEGYGVKVFDVTERSKPKFKFQISAGEVPSDTAVLGSKVYILDSVGQLIEYDLRNSKIYTIPIPGLPKKIKIVGERAYILSDLVDGVIVVDIKKMKFLRVVDLGFQPKAMEIFGNVMVLVGKKLAIVDLSSVESPKLISSIDLPGDAKAIATFGNFVVVGGRNMPVEIYDLSDLKEPMKVGSVQLNYVNSIVVKKGYLITGTDEGLTIIDVSNPAKPGIVKKIDLPSPVDDMELFGNWLYVADSENGLVVYNVVDPWSPRLSVDFDWYNFYDAVGY